MSILRKYEDGRLMDLASTTPNGRIVVTRWPAGRRFTLSAQMAHADEHLEKVRLELAFARGLTIESGRAV